MISVAMAVYNGEKYIKEQLESIRLQTRVPDEVIIMDDCSTDNTAALINEYLKKYSLNWIFEVSSQNRGYIDNFTELLHRVKGDIIFLADQDDIWELDKIALLTDKMSQNPDILALNTSFECIDGDSRDLPARAPIFTSNHGLMICKSVKKNQLVKIKADYNLCYNISMGCTMAFRKELLADFFDLENLKRLPHDWKLNLLAALKDGLYFWNIPCIRYRIHNDNTSSIKMDEHLTLEYRVSVYQKHITYYNEFKEMLSRLSPHNHKPEKLCEILMRYYEERIKALQERRPFKTIGIAIRYIPSMGVKSLPAVMDILSMRKID